jgi:uncharacterized protein YndB with AHSA1/START domain
MEQKTIVTAAEGKQDLVITRQFDLPLELLFKAYEDPEESKKHGNYQYKTTDKNGNKVFGASGVIHEFLPNQKITRTFEMDNSPFGVQLEVYEFEKLSDESSRLRMHVIYESAEQRDQVLKLPFTQGINMAHNRLQEIVKKLK